MQKQSNLTLAAIVVLFAVVVLSWAFGKIPDQTWMYDQTTPCAAGQTMSLDGSALKCY